MRSEATSIDTYIAGLPDDRREAMTTLLSRIRGALPPGYEEAFNFGMITWQVPLSVYPDTYNKKPLMYAALAAQKNHMAVYLCNVYGSPELRARFEAGFNAAGKKLDMGQSCVRFKKLSDVAVDVIADAVAATPLDSYVTHVKAIYAGTKTGQKKAAAKKTAEVKEKATKAAPAKAKTAKAAPAKARPKKG